VIILNKIKKNYFILLYTFLIFYILFNLLDGDRGLISYFDKTKIYKNILYDKEKIQAKLNETEYKISLLSEDIDTDYLEILIREKLFFGKKNEKVYLIKKNEN
tara:strand:+ start:318 stop:626 length:309 start_codon:yes stop_codon:yes gene_type:complete